MKTVKFKIGTYPKDEPKKGVKRVYWWDHNYEEYRQIQVYELEDGDRWIEIPRPEKTEQEKLEDMSDEELRGEIQANLISNYILIDILDMTRPQMIKELQKR